MRSVGWSVPGRAVGLVLGMLLVVGAARAQVVVTSAEPSETQQGTVSLDVTVNGSGFARGARADFFVTGTTNPGGVTVNSTTYRNPNRLTANVTVAAGATLGKFDVKVTLRDGRNGIGIERFRVNRPEYHLQELVPPPGKDVSFSGISDDGLVGGFTCCNVPRVAAVWDLASPQTVLEPMWVDTPPCGECSSLLQGGISADGSWAAGTACDVPPCGTGNWPLMIWERTGSVFVRTVVNPTTIAAPLDLAVVGGLRTVIHPMGLWREITPGNWSAEARPPGNFGLYDSINSTGLVAGTLFSSHPRAVTWDCSTIPCGGQALLPGQVAGMRYWGRHINEAGDVVGEDDSHALVWFKNPIGWDNPVVLPEGTTLLDCGAVASNYVAGMLTVVGSCRSSGNTYAVRWRETSPGTWTAPERLQDLDDSNSRLIFANDVNTAGQIRGQTSRASTGFGATPNP